MKSILLPTLAAWLVRLLAIALNLIGLPFVLARLGQDRFGLFLVVLSIGSWIGFANVGMGRVVASIITRAAHRSPALTARLISMATALAALINLGLFVVATALFLAVMATVPLNDAIAHHRTEFEVSIVSLFLAMSLWFFLSVFEGIDAGHHQLQRLYYFQLGSYALSLVLLFVVFPRHPSIALAAYLLNLSFLLGSIAHGIDVARRNRHLLVRHFGWHRQAVRLLLLSTLDFTIISLGIGILYQLSTGLFGFMFGPDAVLELGVLMRLMQSYGAVLIAFTFPLTNVVASRLAARDSDGARRAARISGLLLLGGAVVASLGALVFANGLLALWLRSGIRFAPGFLAATSLLILLSSLHFYLAALLMGGGETKRAARIHLLEAMLFLPVAYVSFRLQQQTGLLIALDAVLAGGCLAMLQRLRLHPVLGPLTGAPSTALIKPAAALRGSVAADRP
ncbi:hypothetical protein [Bradyrhizobium sp. 2TAF24]|uniref:hypothetical protein n=1 Tax=Bradyrhizobium sp. 2TAF24 TaxID=3233011 RepID=UPI003F8F8777